jgi:hypothetical protein
MPLLYSLPDDAAGMLVLTFVDATGNQFVDLAAWRFDDQESFADAWHSVPEVGGRTAFLLDRHTAEGCDANKYVTPEWIEARCGKPVAELIASGRADLSQWVADWKASRLAA